MHHLIIGYGYCGYYLAQYLLSQQQVVTAVSRHLDNTLCLNGLNHIAQAVEVFKNYPKQPSIIYYLIPPPAGQYDRLLATFLKNLSIKPVKIIYFGSSGVYGNHHGAWVDEQSPCYLNYDRQKSRLHAEEQLLTYCQEKQIDGLVLRIAGIYGPNRLPVAAARQQAGLINPIEAPYINHIYVRDLVKIVVALSQITTKMIYNVGDGHPTLMGFLQQIVAQKLALPNAPYYSFDSIWQTASFMKREFMQSSKRLTTKLLSQDLSPSLLLTPLEKGIIDSL
jgi:nucleoside-diphosphate-sugar epimerase